MLKDNMRFSSTVSIVLISLFSSCGAEPIQKETISVYEVEDDAADRLHDSFNFTENDLHGRLAILPASAADRVYEFLDLAAQMLKMPPGYLTLVDKSHPLSEDDVPAQLVTLDGYDGIRTARSGLFLDRPAAEELERLSMAAQKDGIRLISTSAYRSYNYQKNLFDSYVKKDGFEAAERDSAEAGRSQHQLGTTVDFGSITNAFVESEAGRWLTAEGVQYGWSLSYPKGYEEETGYMWESWHWRWIGAPAAEMQELYFGGIQQRLLEFWHENETIFRDALRE